MFWRTGCIGCGPTCGGRRGHSEPEASPQANRQERSDWRVPTVELAGKTAVEATTRTAKAGTGEVGGGADAGWTKTKTPAVESGVPRTGHCLVPPRSAKTSFPGARTTPLRSVVLSAWGPKKQ